jgi:3-oxoacyl-[acyl-carrier protein] reductase
MSASASHPVAVVAGGSRGIGRAIATRLSKDGYDLLLASSNEDNLRSAAAEISATGMVRVEACATDLRAAAGADEVRARALGAFGRVDVLVNSAGATKGGPFLELGDDVWADGFALKFFGAVRLCRSLWPALSAARGTVINIVGGFARTPAPDFAIAGAVNAALANFSKALAGQGLRDDVNVNVIHPGTTATERLEEIVATRARAEGIPSEQVRSDLAKREKVRRIGEPADVAELVAFLCRPEARHIHGTSISVDGGALRSVF